MSAKSTGGSDTALAVIALIESNIDALIDDMFAVLRQDPALGEFLAPEMVSIGRAIARRDLLHEIHAIKEGWVLPLEPPIEVIETARRTAELDVPVTIPLQSYRAGHRALWATWRAEVEALGLPDIERRALLERAAEFFFDYADRCSAFVVEHYTRYRDEIVRARKHLHYQAVRRLLAGETDELEDPAHDLTRHHLGVIVISDQPDATLAALAGYFQAPPLTVSLDDGTAWAWYSTVKPSRPFDARVLGPPAKQGTVGVGEPGDGVEGFRRTHRQARQALEIALRSRLPHARYRDVALEALGSADDARARDFLHYELAALDQTPLTRAPLRDTVRAYFQSGQNAAQAARKLGVHERTIAYRLNLLETRLGRPVAQRRAELELALRLERLSSPD